MAESPPPTCWPPFSLMQPMIRLTFWAVTVHWWLMFSFSSTSTSKSLAGLLSIPSSPSLYRHWGLPQHQYRLGDEETDLSDRRQWQQDPAWRSRHVSSVTVPPSQVPSQNRYKALQVEPNNNEDDASCSLKVSPRLRQAKPCVKTASIKKKRWVTVIGDSLLRGREGPIYTPDLLPREVCWLAGAQVEDVKRKLPTLVWPSDFYLLLIFYVGSDEVAIRSPRVVKTNFRALGQLIKGSGAQVPFSSVLSVAENDEGRNRKASRSIPASERGVTGRILGFLIMSQVYTTPRLLQQTGYTCLKGGKGSSHGS